MSENVGYGIESICYIDILKKMLVKKLGLNITGSELFFLLNCANIIYANNEIGYNYEVDFPELPFVTILTDDISEIKRVISNEPNNIVLMFCNTKYLVYSKQYINNPTRIHCVEVKDVCIDINKIVLKDSHIRINDLLFKEELAELDDGLLYDIDTKVYKIDTQELKRCFESMEMKKRERIGLEIYSGIFHIGCGLGAIERYLTDKLNEISEANEANVFDIVKDTYYDIKINSLINANQYMCEAMCNFLKFDKVAFQKKYIDKVKYISEKLLYYALKREKNQIANCIVQIINICKEEQELFKMHYNEKSIKESIKIIVAEILNLEIEQIEDQDDLFALGLNSLGKIKILVGIETKYDIELEFYEDTYFRTIEGIYDSVKRYI